MVEFSWRCGPVGWLKASLPKGRFGFWHHRYFPPASCRWVALGRLAFAVPW